MTTAKWIGVLLCILALQGCVAESVADQREAEARKAGYSTGYQEGRASGYAEGYDKGRGEVQAPVLQAQQEGRDTGYREGWQAGNDSGYERGWAEGQKQGFRDAYPGRTPNAGPDVDPYFRLVSFLGGMFLVIAMVAFCGILISRSSHAYALLGKSLAVILGAAATFILYMTMGFGDTVSDVLLAPAPSNQVVFPFILVVAALIYSLFAGARWLLRAVATERMEAICIAGVSATAMAVIILLSRILSVTPSFTDYMISSMMAGVLLGTLAYVMMWFIDRGRHPAPAPAPAPARRLADVQASRVAGDRAPWWSEAAAADRAAPTAPPAPPPPPASPDGGANA